MGQYYRTSSATPLDYMYKLDTPLAERSLMANDKYIDQTVADDNAIGQAAKFNYVQQDADQASKIIGDYTSKTEAIASAIQADPANWRKQTNKISGLKRALVEDYTNGAISKYVSNYNQRKENIDALNKQVDLYNKTGGKDKDGNEVGVSPERAAAYQQHWDDSFKGTNYDPNNPHAYGRYAPARVMNNINIQKRLSAGFDKLKADGTIKTKTSLTGQEQYFNDQTNKWEGLTQTKILGLVRDHFQGDQQLQEYIKQDSQVGAMRGIYYPQDVKDPRSGSIIHRAGELIDPYSIEARGISPEDQHGIDTFQMEINKVKNPVLKQQMKDNLQQHVEQLKDATDVKWNSESGLAPIFRGIVSQYAYSKTEDAQKLRGGTNWGTKFIQANTNARHIQDLKEKQTEFNINTRLKELIHTDDMADKDTDNTLNREKFEWMKDHPTGTKATGTKKTDTNFTAPSVTGVATLSTNSFAGVTTRDINGKTVPMLSTAGLTGDLVAAKTNLTDISAKMQNNKAILDNPYVHTESQVAIAKTENESLAAQKVQEQAKLDRSRDWLNKATNAALTNSPIAVGSNAPLTNEEINLYKEFSNDVSGEKFKQHIANVAKQYPQVKVKSSETTFHYEDAPEVKAEKDKLASYYAAGNKIIKNRDNVLAQLRKDNIDSDAIVPTATESNDIINMVLGNTSNLQLFDNVGTSMTGTDLGGKFYGLFSDNTQHTDPKYKSLGGDFSTGLGDYLKVHNVTTNITRIAPSTKLGSGNGVLEVQFNDPNGKLSNKPFYISLTPELTQDIATKYKTSRNPAVNRIAANMADDEGTSIRNQIAQPKINSVVGSDDTEKNFDILVTAPNGNRAPLNVTRFPSSNKIMVTMTDPETKQQIPFPGGLQGVFGSVDDFIAHFKDIKKNGLVPNSK